jgi:hypothetical protein
MGIIISKHYKTPLFLMEKLLISENETKRFGMATTTELIFHLFRRL